jgi:cytochrome d ubiquinol oxidase subunit I
VGAIATPVQMLVGDQLARYVYENEPVKFAAMELVPKTSTDVPETLLGRLNDDGTVSGGIEIPGLASILSDPSQGTSTEIKGLDAFPEDERPTTSQVNIVHLAWDVMVGLGTALMLLSLWYGAAWVFRRNFPQSKWFLWPAALAGVGSVLAMEAGWIVTEVGRQPWVVVGYMKVEEAATSNSGVWATFLAIVGIYIGLAVTLVLVLRTMSRRFREQGDEVELDGPYGPRHPESVTAGSAGATGTGGEP